MKVTRLENSGNSAKFHVITKNGEFNIALSFTLRTKIWELADEQAELTAATELAEAIVSRHNPKLAFQKLYIFAEHNSNPDLASLIKQIRKHGIPVDGTTREW